MAATKQLQVRFSTQQTEYAITDTPIMVPLTLGRYALSEIVNHLLAKDKHIPFDFLVDGVLLRTTLEEYLASKNLSAENIVTLEYIVSVTPPEKLSSFQTQDWLSDVAIFRSANNPLLLTASYAGAVELWDNDGESLSKHVVSQLPVKCLSVATSKQLGATMAVVGGMDQTAKVLQISTDTPGIKTLYETVGHTGSIESCAIVPDGSLFATASWDGSVNLYSPDTSNVEADEPKPTKRARKSAHEQRAPRLAPLSSLQGHAGAVTAVCFPVSSEVYTGGWDHSVRCWDVENGVNTTTMSCEIAVCAVAYSKRSSLLASGHVDSVIRLWDPRTTEATIVKARLLSHTSQVSSVKWVDDSQFHLCSASFDGSVRLWDTRSTLKPLYTLRPVEKLEDTVAATEKSSKKKLLSVDVCRDLIAACGEDCTISRWSLSDAMLQAKV
ncbi:ribosome biogenesis protein ytm1 [Sorochytrium milnesiophthora]